MKKRYFINEEHMIVYDGQTVQVFKEVLELEELEKEVTKTEVVKTQKKTKPEKVAQNTESMSRPNQIRRLLMSGMKPEMVAEKVGVSIQAVYYHVKKLANEEQGNPKTKKQIEDPQEDLDVIKRGMTLLSEESDVDEEREKDLAEDIKNMWGDQGRNSLAVCNELSVSLNEFNRIIKKYNIIRQ